MNSNNFDKSAQFKFYDWTRKWTLLDENCETERTPDLVDLITIFQILGLSISNIVAHDPYDMSSLDCGEKGLKMIISCSHSGLQCVLEGVNVCSCPQKMIQTVRDTMTFSCCEEKKKACKKFQVLDVPEDEKFVIKTVLQHLVEMMHSVTKQNDQNQNIKKAEQFPNVETKSKTPEKNKKSLDHYVTPDQIVRPIKHETMETSPEVPMSPARYRSLDTLTGKAPLPEFPEPGKLNKIGASEENIRPAITLSSPNLSNKAKSTVNTSSPVTNMAILKQGYSKLLDIQDLVKQIVEIFDKAQDAKEIPQLSFDVSNIKGSNESLNSKKSTFLNFNSNSNLLKRNTKPLCRPSIRSGSVSAYKSTFSTSTSASNIVKPNTTRRLSVNLSPLLKSSTKPSSATKSQKYAHIKSTIPKPSTSKKL